MLPTPTELVANIKAKRLELAVPPTVPARANEVAD
jgi:hypothetical protein